MALKVSNSIKLGGEKITDGDFFSFKYRAYQNDPTPTVIFINKISGTHPNTGHQWRLIQGINLNYIPRKDRKRFVKDWVKTLDKSKSTKFTWNFVKRKYPYLTGAIRRYQYKPGYYISKVEKHETTKEIADAVVRGWFKDFSKFIKRNIGAKLKKLF